MALRVLIADDEKPARDRLRQLLDDLETYDVVGEAANGQEAVTLAAETNPDIVLLDIRMPGLDGIEAAHHLNSLENPPAVVFTTAYDEYAVDAFEARAIGYVLKPVRRDRLAGLGLDPYLTIWTVLGAELYEKQPQEMVDLGHRRHRALAPASAGALFDSYGRRQAENSIDRRTRSWLHELTRIGIERFQIAALTLGEQDIEG